MQEARGKESRWWTYIAGFGIWMLIQLVCMTLRIRVSKETGREGGTPAIFLFWHNRIIPCGYVWRQSDSPFPMCILTSASKDGALVESVLKYFRISTIRGSSHRRVSIALMGIIQSLRAGNSVALTPDGPKGPCYGLNPGVLRIASTTGMPLIPVCIEFLNCWRIRKSWDRLCIPKPFSEIRILWKAPVYIPEGMNEEETEACRVKVEQMLHEGLPDFKPLNF